MIAVLDPSFAAALPRELVARERARDRNGDAERRGRLPLHERREARAPQPVVPLVAVHVEAHPRPHVLAADLARITAPTTVVHGLQDRMVHVSGGRATAAAIPGAELLLIDGMGHDLPPALFDTFASVIRKTAQRGTPNSAP